MTKQIHKTKGKKLLVTMALPYANGEIHLGHLVEAVQTDMYVRFQKLRGNDALYICADDTHGTPIELSAIDKGIAPEELIKTAHANHYRDYKNFGIDFDIFYTTNSDENREYAIHVFNKLKENGFIVEKEIEQNFCEHDKRFLPDRFIVGTCPRCKAEDQYGDVCEKCGATYDPTELKNPKCKLCGNTPVMKRSRHLFVDLVKDETFLRDYLNRPNVLQDDMKNFVLNWIDNGLQQWCISRDGPYFGFEIPGYPGKYFYVWLDAPIGYISSSAKWCHDHNRSIDEFWSAEGPGEVVHFIGKDIVYFHTLFWPVMLKNSGFTLPSRFFIHGFLTVQGEKMSKTRGTFILANRFVEEVKHPLAKQYLRFYYAAKLSSNTADIDLNIEEFCTRVNTTLVNNIGNLHHRTFVFAKRYFEDKIPDAQWDPDKAVLAEQIADEVAARYENADYKGAIEKIQMLASEGNKYYQDSKPWDLVKTNDPQAAVVIVTCANLVRTLLVMLKPVVPDITEIFEKQLQTTLNWDDCVFSLRNCALGETPKLVQPIDPEELRAIIGSASVNGKAEKAEPDNLIDFDQFKNVELKIGTVQTALPIEKADKLLKLTVAIGDETRQIVAGIAKFYRPDDLVGKQVVVVTNLKPAKLRGELSEGMILAATKGKKLVLIQPEKEFPSGAVVS